MFFVKRLKKEILIEPRCFGPKFKELVKNRLTDELEGTSLGKYGYVISIIQMDDADIKAGIIDIDTGSVNVNVQYTAILFRPFVNEVMDAVVTTATETGFFSRVGPLQIFVSRHAMPEDIKFDHERGDCWCSEDQEVEIKETSIVRLRIMGLSIEAGCISAIGTIKDGYLGLFA
mmetsp:Transcript_5306/g.5459  ORF Transcript_5306/g.5459 Transcript_5306/m.5459 type:complete len:174 (+) Transcript_5306:91-612(+)